MDQSRKLQAQEVSLGEEAAAAAAMAPASPTLRSLLQRIAQGCAGYLGRFGYYSIGVFGGGGQLKPAAADAVEVQQQEEEITVVEVQARSMAFKQNRNFEQGSGGRGGRKY